MGIHIIPKKVLGWVEDVSTDGLYNEKYLNTTTVDGFDSCRMSGDKDFYNYLTEEECDIITDEGQIYYRPKDIGKLKDYVKFCDDIPEGNKPRLMGLLNIIQTDKSVYIYISH